MKNSDAFCSICTVNHAAYAATLNDSLRSAGHTEPHYVLVPDFDPVYREIIDTSRFTPVYLHELGIPKLDELIAKYSAFELSNVLRPYFMEWLLTNHPEIRNLVYLDSDIYVYSPLSAVLDHLEKNPTMSVVLTPHLNDPEAYAKVHDYRFEKAFFTYGLYNSGFYVFKNDENSRRFLEWHKGKLFDHCYNAPSEQMFVDQRILDFAPLLFDFVSIYRNTAYNIAHWNYSPHMIQEIDGVYFVKGDKVVFVHFSQLPPDMTSNFYFDVSEDDKRMFRKMASEYLERLRANGHEHIRKIPYGYAGRYARSVSKSRMYGSGMWRLVVGARKAADIFLPKGTARRKAFSSVLRFFKIQTRRLRLMMQ